MEDPQEWLARQRRGRAVATFRASKGLKPSDIYKRGGPDPRTQEKIERGEYVYEATLRRHAEAAGWSFDSRTAVELGLSDHLEPVEADDRERLDEEPAISTEARLAGLRWLKVSVSPQLRPAEERQVLAKAREFAQQAVDDMQEELLKRHG